MLRFCIEIVQPSSDQGDMPMLFDPMVDGGRVNPSPSQGGPSPSKTGPVTNSSRRTTFFASRSAS
jgi:hypothetical protein